jgi:hypothetical protein
VACPSRGDSDWVVVVPVPSSGGHLVDGTILEGPRAEAFLNILT